MDDEKILEKLGKISGDMTEIKISNGKIEGRLTGIENRMTGIENRMTGIENRHEEFRSEIISVYKFMFLGMITIAASIGTGFLFYAIS